MLFFAFKLLAMVIVSVHAINKDKLKIYGGKNVPLVITDRNTGLKVFQNTGEFPYLVSVQHSGKHACGGTLIKADVVLTAAHCTVGIEADDITILAGAILLEEKSKNIQLRRIKYYVNHENYDKALMHDDLCLIKTVTPFHINNIIKVINLPNATDRFIGYKGVIVGWGDTESSLPSRILKMSSLTVIDANECAAYYHPLNVTTHNIICGIDKIGKVRSICSGDSGGPVVIFHPDSPVKDILAGVNSWVSKADKYCEPEFPSVFVDIVKLLPWLKRELNTQF